MQTFIYGSWRGLPAREDVKTGVRFVWITNNDRDYSGRWQELASGYCTEFRPWPEELARANGGDQVAALHRT